MKYEFKCKNCGKTQIINVPMSEISNTGLICECGTVMKRVWSSSFVVPEHMKNENAAQMSYLNNIMKTRPSGKRKVLF